MKIGSEPARIPRVAAIPARTGCEFTRPTHTTMQPRSGACEKLSNHKTGVRLTKPALASKISARCRSSQQVEFNLMSAAPLLQTSIADLQLIKRGKVRDVYAVDEQHLLIVVTDRISAFDCILPTP